MVALSIFQEPVVSSFDPPGDDFRDGELVYAVMFFEPPKGTPWRPRSPFSVPPLQEGWRGIWRQSHDVESVLREVLEGNRYILETTKPGKPPRLWSIAVRMIYGRDETARPVEGGGA